MTVVDGQGSAPTRRGLLPRLLCADLVLGSLVLVVFVLAFLQTGEWSFRTALFPRMVTVAGIALSGLFVLVTVVGVVREHHRADRPDPGTPEQDKGAELLDEDEERDNEMEYVYASAGRGAWAQALGFVALFIGLLWAGGLFVAAGVFSLTYLRFGARRTWLFSVVYAVVMTAVLYVFLGLLLPVSVPEGLFG